MDSELLYRMKWFSINCLQGNKCFLIRQEFISDILLSLNRCWILDSSSSNSKIDQFQRMFSPYLIFPPLLEAHFIVLPILISYQHLLQHIFSLFCQHVTSIVRALLTIRNSILNKMLQTLFSFLLSSYFSLNKTSQCLLKTSPGLQVYLLHTNCFQMFTPSDCASNIQFTCKILSEFMDWMLFRLRLCFTKVWSM